MSVFSAVAGALAVPSCAAGLPSAPLSAGEAPGHVPLSIQVPTCTFFALLKNTSGTKFILCDTDF